MLVVTEVPPVPNGDKHRKMGSHINRNINAKKNSPAKRVVPVMKFLEGKFRVFGF